ncbi:MAG: DUF554 domain-containing protein [Clostridia bacterium]|nr:DUF554 domain-containing protein [Clostridia bacterium]
MLGTWVNVATVMLGSLIGMFLKRGLPERIAKGMTTAVALAVLYIGIDGMAEGANTLVLVLSLVFGALIGTLLNLDERLNRLGGWLEKKISKNGEPGKITEGFVSASLLFCVGAMTIVGPLQSGLSGNHEMQFTKAILDLISAIVLASTLGGGVMLSAVTVLILQGSITLLAQVIAPFLSDYVIAEMTCSGSVLILALGMNLLGITKIKLVNSLPAVFLPILFCIFLKV